MSADDYMRIRCPRCGRMLAEATHASALRIKCGRCKAVVWWPAPAAIRRS